MLNIPNRVDDPGLRSVLLPHQLRGKQRGKQHLVRRSAAQGI